MATMDDIAMISCSSADALAVSGDFCLPDNLRHTAHKSASGSYTCL